MEYQGIGIEELVSSADCLGREIPEFTVERYDDYYVIIIWHSMDSPFEWYYYICLDHEDMFAMPKYIRHLIDPRTGEEFSESMGIWIEGEICDSWWLDERLQAFIGKYDNRWTVQLCILYLKEVLIPDILEELDDQRSRSVYM